MNRTAPRSAPHVALSLLLLLLPGAALGQRDTAPAGAPSPGPIAAILTAEQVSQFQISPDGRWVVWVKSTVDPDKGRVSNLYLSSLTEAREVQLTRGTVAHSSPRRSPDGRLVAFLSSRPHPEPKPDAAKTQLWVIDPSGGEPWPLTGSERGVRAFEWRGSATLLPLAQEGPTRAEGPKKKEKDDPHVVDDPLHEAPGGVFFADGEGDRVRRGG